MERPNLHQKQKMAKATLTKDIEVLDKLLHVQHKQLESALFILWRHVEYYLSAAPNKPQVFIIDHSSNVKFSIRMSQIWIIEFYTF